MSFTLECVFWAVLRFSNEIIVAFEATVLLEHFVTLTNKLSRIPLPFLPPTLLSVRFLSMFSYSSLKMSLSRISLNTLTLKIPLKKLRSRRESLFLNRLVILQGSKHFGNVCCDFILFISFRIATCKSSPPVWIIPFE